MADAFFKWTDPNEVYERPDEPICRRFHGLHQLDQRSSAHFCLALPSRNSSIPISDPYDAVLLPAFAAGTKVSFRCGPENIKIARLKRILNGDNVLEGRIKEQSVCLGVADYAIDVRGIELRVRSAVNGRDFFGWRNR